MAFNFNIKDNKNFSPLSEQEIRNKLYGSAVGMSVDTFDAPEKKKKESRRKESAQKDSDGKNFLSDDVQTRNLLTMRDELDLLKRELEQARKRLKKVKNVSVKRMRLVIVYIMIAFALMVLIFFSIKKVFINKPRAVSIENPVAVNHGSYRVQVGVFEKDIDAERLKVALQAKGYDTFIHKTAFSSGRDKFIIYAGPFTERSYAQDTANKLKTEEGIADAFVAAVPKK
jgi:hypothetical protein